MRSRLENRMDTTFCAKFSVFKLILALLVLSESVGALGSAAARYSECLAC